MNGASKQNARESRLFDDDDDGAEDLYAVLKIDRAAPNAAIHRSYKSLSRNFHPDKRLVHKSEAQKTFVQIKQAYEVLSDPVLRLAYDHGGMGVVELIKLSQVKAAQQSENVDMEHGSAEENLYVRLLSAQSRMEAIEIVHDILERQEIHQQIKGRLPSIEGDVELVQVFAPPKATADSSGGSSSSRWLTQAANVQIEVERPLTPRVEMSIAGTTAVARRKAPLRSTRVSLAYQHDNYTHVSASGTLVLDGKDHHQPQGLAAAVPGLTPVVRPVRRPEGLRPQFTLQTSRNLFNDTHMSVGMVGGTHSPWHYTVSTTRILWLGSLLDSEGQQQQQEEPHPSGGRNRSTNKTRVHATWSLGTSLRGDISSISMALRNLSFPQWKIRLELLGGDSMLKCSWQHARHSPWMAGIAWDYWTGTFQVKCTKEDNVVNLLQPPTPSQQLSALLAFWWPSWIFGTGFGLGSMRRTKRRYDDWTLRYGLKYDLQPSTNVMHSWSIILHLNSSDWNIRVPILLPFLGSQSTMMADEWPLATVLLLLLNQLCDPAILMPRITSSVSKILTTVSQRTISKDKDQPLVIRYRGNRNRESDLDPSSVPWYVHQPETTTDNFLLHDEQQQLPYKDIVRKIAAKKRFYERERNGLVILQAIWQAEESSFNNIHEMKGSPLFSRTRNGNLNGSIIPAPFNFPSGSGTMEDVTDMLQFWVVDGHLHLPIHSRRWWSTISPSRVASCTASPSSHTGDDVRSQRGDGSSGSQGNTDSWRQVRVWAWNWFRLAADPCATAKTQQRDREDAGTLYVRYQHDGKIYEIRFLGDEMAWLPNTLATMIGVEGKVE